MARRFAPYGVALLTVAVATALRAKVIAVRRKAPLADALIAKCCLDRRVRLVARDSEFRHFVKLGGLEVLP